MPRTITERVVLRARELGVTVYTRRQWGSVLGHIYAARIETKPARQPADTVVQHITVTHRTNIKADMRTLEKIGNERFGSGVSYNFAVDMTTGEVGVGQPLEAKGTHTVNNKDIAGYSYDQNYAARGIAVIGMPGDKLSERAETAIVLLLRAMVDEGAITPGFDYDPHSKFAYKDCPCDSTRDRMPEIRRAVDALTEESQPAKPTHVTEARDLLGQAVDAAKRPRRRRRIREALKKLPRR